MNLLNEKVSEGHENNLFLALIQRVWSNILSSQAIYVKNSPRCSFKAWSDWGFFTWWCKVFKVDHVPCFVKVRKTNSRNSSVNKTRVIGQFLKAFDKTSWKFQIFLIESVLISKINHPQWLVQPFRELIGSVVLNWYVNIFTFNFNMGGFLNPFKCWPHTILCTFVEFEVIMREGLIHFHTFVEKHLFGILQDSQSNAGWLNKFFQFLNLIDLLIWLQN